jgi:phage terminase large subunit-like protein
MINDYLQAIEDKRRLSFDFYKPHPKALEFHNLGSLARDRLFLAANRIGKTMACSLEVCMHATGTYPDWWQGHRYNKPVNVWVGGITEKEINILERRYFDGDVGELPWIHPNLVLYRNQTKHTYHIGHVSGNISIITFKTYQQGRLTWQGEKLDLCHLDEEPPLDIYVEASLRLMSTSPNHQGKMLVSATCLYYSQFVQSFTEEVVDVQTLDGNGNSIQETKQIQCREGEIKNGRVFLMAGWNDAPHLTIEEQLNLKTKIPPHEIEARSKGIPSIGSGMVYPVSESLITCDPFELPDSYYFVAGMDFGWKDPTALLMAAIDRDNDIIYIFHEYAMSEKTPEQHVFHLHNTKAKDYLNWIPIVHDPAGGASSQKDGKSLVTLYRESGFTRLHKANNSREAGVQKTLQRMQNGKLKIFKTCTKLLTELRMYARDEEGMIKDGNDHLLDALRYLVMSGPALAGARPHVVDIKQMQQAMLNRRRPRPAW